MRARVSVAAGGEVAIRLFPESAEEKKNLRKAVGTQQLVRAALFREDGRGGFLYGVPAPSDTDIPDLSVLLFAAPRTGAD